MEQITQTESNMVEPSEVIRSFILSKRRLSDLDNDAMLFEDRIINSMFVLQLIAFIEERFLIVVEDDDLEIKNFASVNNIAAFIRKKTPNGREEK